MSLTPRGGQDLQPRTRARVGRRIAPVVERGTMSPMEKTNGTRWPSAS